jgi:site-specific recombinase XerD
MKEHPLISLSETYLSSKYLARLTLKSYRLSYKHYINYLNEQGILYAKTSDIIRFRESLRDKGYSSVYIYTHISALKGLYRYLKLNQKHLNLSTEYCFDIMEPIKNERIKRQIKKEILTLDQARKLITQTKKKRKTIRHYRNHAIIYLMLTSGLRSHEIVHAKRCDFKLVDGSYLLYFDKLDKERLGDFVKIAPGGVNALNEYLNRRKDSNPYLFISHKYAEKNNHLSKAFFQHMFKKVLSESGLTGSNITPHSLRHSAGTFNLLRGGTVEQTRGLLRHIDIGSTLVYKDYIDRLHDDSASEIEKFLLKEDDVCDQEDYYFILE